MIRVEVISLGTQINSIHLNPHSHRVAIFRSWHIVVDQIVRLQHLQRERDAAIAKRTTNQTNKDFARLSQTPASHALDVMEAQSSTHIAAAFMTPVQPCFMDPSIHRFI